MTDEHNNKDSTKEYKDLKNQLDAHDETRVFERVTEQPTMSHRFASTGEQTLASSQAEEVQQGKKAKREKKAANKNAKPMPPWLKVTLKVLRILIIPFICLIALYIGLYIGYVGFGKEDPGDIWKFGTWKHIFDLIFADGSSS